MDSFSVLNYQGSKKNLINFIHENTSSLISPEQTILDIFAGTCSVGYSYKRTNRIFANDSEAYSYNISKALLGDYSKYNCTEILKQISKSYNLNLKRIKPIYKELALKEANLIENAVQEEISNFYEGVPTVWNGQAFSSCDCYDLFTVHFSSSYFGVNQSMGIDSLRFAFEQYKSSALFSPLLSSLYFAMKECVFAKDGHMAQPLDVQKNFTKLIKQRKKSIDRVFQLKFTEFFESGFAPSSHKNVVYNLDFEELLKIPKIQNEVDFIYADPPYTDMQYSRYYHLLNFVTVYRPLEPTIINGSYTKGLYTQGRFQSKLSTRSTCLKTFSTLVMFAKVYRKNLAVSFAYPHDLKNQKTDRYVMSIEDLISLCQTHFGKNFVEVVSCDYYHSNNRNSAQKKVLEYLVLCKATP